MKGKSKNYNAFFKSLEEKNTCSFYPQIIKDYIKLILKNKNSSINTKFLKTFLF